VYDLSVTGIGALNPPPCLLPGERAILALLLEEHGTLAVNVEVMHCADTAGSRRAGMQFVLQAPEELLPLVSYLAQLWNEFQPSVS
jgi:hypothetical protein